MVGFDLMNEPKLSATWGSGNLSTDWNIAAEKCGNAVLAKNPDVLIIVEGVQWYGNFSFWWGGNLMAARDTPLRLAYENRLVYSTHVYNQVSYSEEL